MTTEKVAALAAALLDPNTYGFVPWPGHSVCTEKVYDPIRLLAALEAAGLTIAATPPACDHCDGGWPRYHEGPEDPEGIEGRQRVPCSA